MRYVKQVCLRVKAVFNTVFKAAEHRSERAKFWFDNLSWAKKYMLGWATGILFSKTILLPMLGMLL